MYYIIFIYYFHSIESKMNYLTQIQTIINNYLTEIYLIPSIYYSFTTSLYLSNVSYTNFINRENQVYYFFLIWFSILLISSIVSAFSIAACEVFFGNKYISLLLPIYFLIAGEIRRIMYLNNQ